MSVLRYFITSKAKRNLLKFFFSREGAYYTREVARLTGEPLNAVRRELGYMEKAGLLHSYMQGNQKYYEVIEAFPLLGEWKKIVLGTDDSATPARRKAAIPAQTEAPKPMTSAAESETADTEPILPGAQVIMCHEPVTENAEETAQPVSAQASAAATTGRAGEPAFTVSSFIDYLKAQFDDVNSIALAIVHGDATKSEEIPEGGVDLLVVGDVEKDTLLELVGAIEDSTGIGIKLTRMTRSDFDYRNAKGDPFVRRMWGEKKLVVKGRH
jgi:DNA-binding transcriptional ArsR family regulator